MAEASELEALLRRIAADTHSAEDLATLRQALVVGGERNVVQIGKYNFLWRRGGFPAWDRGVTRRCQAARAGHVFGRDQR